MKKPVKIILIVALVLLIVGVGAWVLIRHLGQAPELAPIQMSDAAVTVERDNQTIVFQPDNKYELQGKTSISGFSFNFQGQGAYLIQNRQLSFPEEHPVISVSSVLGSFDMEGNLTAACQQGIWHIHLEASNETQTFQLIDMDLTEEEATTLGLDG
ncbi:MAG: hypothetical protein IKS31_04725 [Clostridia bacterium]|nr:hypothetical protein [Clostridia bacterium]